MKVSLKKFFHIKFREYKVSRNCIFVPSFVEGKKSELLQHMKYTTFK